MADSSLLAVLIDADNISHKYAGALFEEIAGIGEASVRRIYGDFAKPNMSSWGEVQAEFGLVPQHQPANTVGKNSSDIALVIDAMDLMHSARFDGFVIVSSDSDFARLASRIREQGLDVYGVGEQKTPEVFRKSCKRFIYLENLVAPKRKRKLKEAQIFFMKAMDAIDQEDDWYALGPVGSRIRAANADFDPRNYGFSKLSALAAALEGVESRRNGLQLFIKKKS